MKNKTPKIYCFCLYVAVYSLCQVLQEEDAVARLSQPPPVAVSLPPVPLRVAAEAVLRRPGDRDDEARVARRLPHRHAGAAALRAQLAADVRRRARAAVDTVRAGDGEPAGDESVRRDGHGRERDGDAGASSDGHRTPRGRVGGAEDL